MLQCDSEGRESSKISPHLSGEKKMKETQQGVDNSDNPGVGGRRNDRGQIKGQ